jgi:hypothetical protein
MERMSKEKMKRHQEEDFSGASWNSFRILN